MTIEISPVNEHPNGVKEVPPAQVEEADADAEEGEEDAVADGTPATGERSAAFTLPAAR